MPLRVDSRRPARREECCNRRHKCEDADHQRDRQRVQWRDVAQIALKKLAEAECASQPQ